MGAGGAGNTDNSTRSAVQQHVGETCTGCVAVEVGGGAAYDSGGTDCKRQVVREKTSLQMLVVSEPPQAQFVWHCILPDGGFASFGRWKYSRWW